MSKEQVQQYFSIFPELFRKSDSRDLREKPTSNIDSLNEGIILKSLEREKQDKTILLVSHRKSTMGIADDVKVLQRVSVLI